MKAALYCRVSTDIQNEGYSIDAQKELLAAFCKAKQIDDYSFYIDGGFSGSNIDRPMLEKLIEDCQNKKIGIVIVYKLDRLSRSQKDTLYLIEEVFIPNGVDFISISENFDTTSPFGKAMIGILSVFAQLERETIKERTRMGMKERVKKGYWPGGGKTPFGYDYDTSNGMLVPNANAPIVKRIFELYIEGWSAERIAKYFNLKYDRLIVQILKGKINCGLIEFRGEVYQGKHEPIVSKEVFDEANRIMQKRSRNNIRSGKNLLTGLIYCGKCGAKMRYQKWGKAGHKICCYSQQSSKEYMIKDINCDNTKYWADEIEQAIISQLLSFAINPDLIEEKIDRSEMLRAQNLKNSLSDIERRVSNLLTLISEGIAVEETKNRLRELKEEKDRVRKLLVSSIDNTKKISAFKEKITKLDDVWEELSIEQKRAIIHSLIDRIVLTNDKCDIYYAFEG